MSVHPSDLPAARASTSSASPFAPWGHALDLSGSHDLPLLVDLVRSVSQASSPVDVQRRFGAGIRRIRPIDASVSVSVRGLPPGSYKVTRVMADFRLLDLDDPATGRAVPQERIAASSAPDPWRDWDSIPERRGGLIGEIVQHGQPLLLSNLRAVRDPILGPLMGDFGSLAAVPLYDDGQPLNWVIFLGRGPSRFDLQFLEQMLLEANLVGGTVRNVLAAQRLREADERAREEFTRIAAIQAAFLPRRMPDVPGLDLAAHTAAFDQAGGDVYAARIIAVRNAPAPQLALLLADASGHGPAAAVMSGMVHAIFSTVPEPFDGPAALLETLNRYLAAHSIESTFVTAFAALVDPATRTLRWASAGHPPALLRPRQEACGQVGRVRVLNEVGDLVLGIEPDVTYHEASLVMDPGDRLVVYSDGINEARSPDGAEFGTDGMIRALSCCDGTARCAAERISTALREFEGGRPPTDDQSLLVLQAL